MQLDATLNIQNLPYLACMFAFCRISTAADLTFGALSSVGNAQMKQSEEFEGASRYDAGIWYTC